MWLNTFDDVVKRYESIKVLVSTNHKLEQDIRPIGSRNKKWERIVKYDDNTYGLSDGNYAQSLWSGASGNQMDINYQKSMSAILWERRKDGDYVTIRNGTVGGAHISRYKFIDFWMPKGMSFHVHNGQQTVMLKSGLGFPLPKTQHMWDYQNNKPRYPDDGMKLCFKVLGDGEFERVGDPLPVKTKTLDKQTKKQYKPLFNAFFEWMTAITPMLDNTWRGRDEYRGLMRDWAKEVKLVYMYWSPQLTDLGQEHAVAIMSDENHPMRIALASMINEQVRMHEVENEDDVKRAKSRYNTAINKLFQFYKTEVL